jgi:hypothetical protein
MRAEAYHSDVQSKIIELRRAVALTLLKQKVLLKEIKEDCVSDLWTPAAAQAFLRDMNNQSPEQREQQKVFQSVLVAAARANLNLLEYRAVQSFLVESVARGAPPDVATAALETEFKQIARSILNDFAIAIRNIETLSKSHNLDLASGWMREVDSHQSALDNGSDDSVEFLQHFLIALQSFAAKLSQAPEAKKVDALRDMVQHLENTRAKSAEQVQTWTHREAMGRNQSNEDLALMIDFRRRSYERLSATIEQYLPSLQEAVASLFQDVLIT